MLNFRTFAIWRLDPTDESDESDYRVGFQDTEGAITGHLGQASPEFAALVEGSFGQTFVLTSDDLEADVRIGDRLMDGDESYEVKGIQPAEDGPGRRVQITLTRQIQQ